MNEIETKKKTEPQDWGVDEDQIKFRAQHGGLDWEKTRHGNREINARLRDRAHARLLENLSPVQQEAMIEIARGYSIITGGIGFKTFDPFKVGGSGQWTDADARRASEYISWAQEVQKRRISHAMAVAMIVEGMSAREVSRTYRVRNAFPLSNIRAALNVWCEQHGWPCEPV